MNVFIINGGQRYLGAHGGSLNATIVEVAVATLRELGHEVRTTDINDPIDHEAEVQKYLWADAVLYTIPIWWFHMPYRLKEYLDTVLMAGTGHIYQDDGRTRSDASKKYGSGGLSQGKQYLLISTWNAPEEAFTDPQQFFGGRSVDDGVLYPFHRMKAFLGFDAPLPSFHFYDVLKSDRALVAERIEALKQHLQTTFA